MRYDFKTIEPKWQKRWEQKKVFHVKEKKGKKKFYILEMYPYPSAAGLHVGHGFNYVIGDIFARFKIMNGFDVLHPMGFDSFGLPAENAAIKNKSHPKKFTEKAIANYIKQQKALGISYDWARIIQSHSPDFYKWDQWIFLKMLEKELAYKKKAPVNWCPRCNSVLANEQVHDGKCWIHKDTEVEIRHLEQWFLKITNYAKKLYDDIGKLKNWPEDIKAMQKNWIGESYGTEIDFEIDGKKWAIFTTRADTIYGVTFMVISAQHPQLMELVTEKQKKDVGRFLKKIKSTSEKDMEELEKEGVFTGAYAVNPLTKEKVPIWVGNFVVADYGSGMVMGVPAHDQRDFEFAKKYGLKIKQVISGGNIKEKAYVGEGKLIDSKKFNGMNSKKAIDEITKYLIKKKLGRKKIEYRLKDWLLSRQRFWGTPIPVVYCEKCGIVPVPEKDLPVKLPENINFKTKKNPLIDYKKFIDVKCPKCKGKARRETDTMDTFVNSSWYFLRYCDSKNKKKIFDKKKVEYWMPIDLYIGGKEHACMHLIYFRFYTKFLKDLGLLRINEPVIKLFNQGMIHGEDGFVMSKSRGNVVDPLDIIKKCGADTLRLYYVSMASPDKDSVWDDKGVESVYKFIKKIYNFFERAKVGKSSAKLESKVNKTIKEVSDNIENLKYNLGVIKLRQLFDVFVREGQASKKDLENFLKMLCVFCPHIAEELWHKIGNKNFISLEKWPVADLKKIDEKFEEQEKIEDKVVSDINNILKFVEKKVSKAFVYVLPKELSFYDKKNISKRTGLDIEIFAVDDKKKYDPENRSKKAKPGSPGIYLE